MGDVLVRLDQAAIDALAGPAGPVGQEVTRRMVLVRDRARRNAPVSPTGAPGNPPGWLREHIEVRAGRDALGPYVDVVSTARSRGGYPYGTWMESRKPHIRPAVQELYGRGQA